MSASTFSVRSALVLSCAMLLVSVNRSVAADGAGSSAKPAKPAPSSLDDELLKGLDNPLLGESKDDAATKPAVELGPAAKEPKPFAKPVPAPRAADKPSDPLDQQLRESLGGEDIGQAGEDANPLVRIERQMREVQQRLAEQHSDAATQRQQQRIAAELAALVKQLAEQQQQQQSSSSSKLHGKSSARDKARQPGKSSDPKSDQPALNSSDKLRAPKTDRPDVRSVGQLVEKALDRLHLPDKEREEMLQAPPDEFLPGYEAAIRRYFERIVEDESTSP